MMMMMEGKKDSAIKRIVKSFISSAGRVARGNLYLAIIHTILFVVKGLRLSCASMRL